VSVGDLTQKITGVKVAGEILDLVNTINGMIDQLAVFAREVTRVAREVGTEGRLGVQAEVENVQGTWQAITYVIFLGFCLFKSVHAYSFITVQAYLSTQWLPI